MKFRFSFSFLQEISSSEQFHHLTEGQLVRFSLEGKIDSTHQVGGGHQHWVAVAWQVKLASKLDLLTRFPSNMLTASHRIGSLLDQPFRGFSSCFQR